MVDIKVFIFETVKLMKLLFVIPATQKRFHMAQTDVSVDIIFNNT